MDVFKTVAISGFLFLNAANGFAETAFDRVKAFYDNNHAAQISELGDRVVWTGKCVSSSNPTQLIAVQMPVFSSNDPVFGGGTFAFLVNDNPWSSAQNIRYGEIELQDAAGAIKGFETDPVLDATILHASTYFSRQDRRYKGPFDMSARSNNENNRFTLVLQFISQLTTSYCYFTSVVGN